MLPGVESARRRRVHYHGDVGPQPATASPHHIRDPNGAVTGVVGPALAARIRLEEKLRRGGGGGGGGGGGSTATAGSGAALTFSRPRWSRLMRDGRESRRAQPMEPINEQRVTALNPNPSTIRRAELTRTLSRVDVCAVCLDEVQAEQRVTRLPCSHKYHSDCVLPWLALHPDCPCCRTLVPSDLSMLS